MSDNISRQAVLDILKYDVWHDKIEAIEALPSTDRTGHWIDRIEEHGDSIGIYPWEMFKCSECGHLTAGNEYKFCPRCGADMRGENDERKQMGL